MKKWFRLFIAALGIVSLASGTSLTQDDKPLGPGWLSLDGSVGLMDKGIADAKGGLEKALGINVGGFLDTS
ncbi:MAG TPA: hypothetical protein VGB09_07385, partial [Candidatus Binatia bacterium]